MTGDAPARSGPGSHGGTLAAFAQDYRASRTTFVALARESNWSVLSYPTGEEDPAGDPLTIDVALAAGTPPFHAAFVLSSGLHGVEGPFGSIVQTMLLARWSHRGIVPPGVRVVLVHALNPYGWAWGRRVDRHNVDLNRAFRTGSDAPTDSDAAYRSLDPLLNPPRPPAAFEAFTARLFWAAVTRGTSALRRSIASGQRTFPQGLFYGGTAPPPLQALLEQELPAWIAGAGSVVHLDLHTGLGRRGERLLILDYPVSDADRRWWGDVFRGERVVESARQAGGYTAQGSLGQWLVDRSFAREYRFAFAEFATVGDRKVLAALRAENRAHFWAAPDDPCAARARSHLLESFSPSGARWRARATGAAVALSERAVSAVARA